MYIPSESGYLVPAYGTRPKKPGLYLALLHGREYPQQQMSDWGFDGPLIGPLEWCHTTYATHVRIKFSVEEDEGLYFEEACFPDAQDIFIHEDLITYDGKFYGDWTVFSVSPEETERLPDTFRDAARRVIPLTLDVK